MVRHGVARIGQCPRGFERRRDPFIRIEAGGGRVILHCGIVIGIAVGVARSKQRIRIDTLRLRLRQPNRQGARRDAARRRRAHPARAGGGRDRSGTGDGGGKQP